MGHKLYQIAVSTKNMGVFFDTIATLTQAEYNYFVDKSERMGFIVQSYQLEYTAERA